MTSFTALGRSGALILTDGGIETRMIFEKRLPLDPVLEVAALLDDNADPAARAALEQIYRDYLRVAAEHGLPVIIGTPTFRASPARIEASGRPPDDVSRLNQAAVAMHRRLIADTTTTPAFVAGVIGPRRDAYRPAEAMGPDEARIYHTPQARALAGAGADFLFAPTFPAVDEAIGVAMACAACGIPYVISFVIDADGKILDGTPLHHAITTIDGAVASPPLHYSISCVHPSVIARALAHEAVSARLREAKANASPLPPSALDGIGHLEADAPQPFARGMWTLHERFGLTILGGCCGTDDRHMAALADLMQVANQSAE